MALMFRIELSRSLRSLRGMFRSQKTLPSIKALFLSSRQGQGGRALEMCFRPWAKKIICLKNETNGKWHTVHEYRLTSMYRMYHHVSIFPKHGITCFQPSDQTMFSQFGLHLWTATPEAEADALCWVHWRRLRQRTGCSLPQHLPAQKADGWALIWSTQKKIKDYQSQ